MTRRDHVETLVLAAALTLAASTAEARTVRQARAPAPADVAIAERAPAESPALWSPPRVENDDRNTARDLVRALHSMMTLPVAGGVRVIPRANGVGFKFQF